MDMICSLTSLKGDFMHATIDHAGIDPEERCILTACSYLIEGASDGSFLIACMPSCSMLTKVASCCSDLLRKRMSPAISTASLTYLPLLRCAISLACILPNAASSVTNRLCQCLLQAFSGLHWGAWSI